MTLPTPSNEEQRSGLGGTVLVIQVAFLAVLSVLLMAQGFFPTIEWIVVLVVLLLIWRGRERRLLAALMPFLLLLITYQFLRGFADDFTPMDIHVTDLIAWEKALFRGVIPAAWVQANFTSPALTRILDPILNVAYMGHFVYPVLLGTVLWYRRHDWYWPFMAGLIIMSYTGFVAFLLFPAAPPWWATRYGYMLDQPVTLARFAMPLAIEVGSPNPVAAMPSLHCAYIAYIALVSLGAWGRKAWWVLLWVGVVSFSTVYLGHHWVIDIFAGYLFAVDAFLLAWIGRRMLLKRQALKRLQAA